MHLSLIVAMQTSYGDLTAAVAGMETVDAALHRLKTEAVQQEELLIQSMQAVWQTQVLAAACTAKETSDTDCFAPLLQYSMWTALQVTSPSACCSNPASGT